MDAFERLMTKLEEQAEEDIKDAQSDVDWYMDRDFTNAVDALIRMYEAETRMDKYQRVRKAWEDFKYGKAENEAHDGQQV